MKAEDELKIGMACMMASLGICGGVVIYTVLHLLGYVEPASIITFGSLVVLQLLLQWQGKSMVNSAVKKLEIF